MRTTKKNIFLFLMMCLSLSSMNAEDGTSQSGTTSETDRVIKIVVINDAKIRRSPIRFDYDVLLAYDETEVNVYFRSDLGVVDYQLTNTVTGESYADIVETSFNNSVTIPMQISESYSYDFQIELEDGSRSILAF